MKLGELLNWLGSYQVLEKAFVSLAWLLKQNGDIWHLFNVFKSYGILFRVD
jgi:hypothetical protein